MKKPMSPKDKMAAMRMKKEGVTEKPAGKKAPMKGEKMSMVKGKKKTY